MQVTKKALALVAAAAVVASAAACGTAPAPESPESPESTFTTLPSPPPAQPIDALPKGVLDRLDPSPELLANGERAREAKAPLVVGVPASKSPVVPPAGSRGEGQPAAEPKPCWTVVLTPQGNGSWRQSVTAGWPAPTGVALDRASEWPANGNCAGEPRYAPGGPSVRTGAAVVRSGSEFGYTDWWLCNPRIVVITPETQEGRYWSTTAPLTTAGAVMTDGGWNRWGEGQKPAMGCIPAP